jgi:hypothetical protein
VARTLRRPIRDTWRVKLSHAQLWNANKWMQSAMEPREESFGISADKDSNGNVWFVSNLATYLIPKPTRANRGRKDKMQRIPHESVVRIEELHSGAGLTRVITATWEGTEFTFSGRFSRREDPTVVRALSRLTGVDVMTVRAD